MKLNMMIGLLLSASLIFGCVPPPESENKQVLQEQVSKPDSIIPKQVPVAVPQYDKNYLSGKFDPSKHPDFMVLPSKYCADNKVIYVRKETGEALIKMIDAASKDSLIFTVLSGTRNFEYQARIWESKWEKLTPKKNSKNAGTLKDPLARAKRILQFTAMPGSSRHHWGTDVDLNELTNSYFTKGKGKKQLDWLNEHATSFGFHRPYTEISPLRPTGYLEEKWHWSYIPLSKEMTKQAGEKLTNSEIAGFSGSSTSIEIDIVKNYILGISKDCL
jgi:zinc D-Ala-D-Ala carboxypeptidase